MEIRIPRTVAQLPARHAARFSPIERQRPAKPAEGLFPIARQILAAATDQERAAILLRLPDEVIVTKGTLLKDACLASQFSLGAHFLDTKIAALTATRGKDGKLPEQHVLAVETWRRGMHAFANGVKA